MKESKGGEVVAKVKNSNLKCPYFGTMTKCWFGWMDGWINLILSFNNEICCHSLHRAYIHRYIKTEYNHNTYIHERTSTRDTSAHINPQSTYTLQLPGRRQRGQSSLLARITNLITIYSHTRCSKAI